MITKETTTIGFIGTGVMGKSMAGHLLKAGYEVIIYTRTKEKAEKLLNMGANWVDSPEEIAKVSQVIITMVGYPQDVREIYLGDRGLVKHGKSASYFIDMTTSDPSLAEEIYEAGAKKGIHVLDCPVSGGDVGAKNASLAIMVGGNKAAYEEVLPILEVMGDNIVYQGGAGSGQHTKMCNQIVIASGMIGVCESLVYAKEAGLDPEKVLESISTGAAGSWSLSNLAPRIIKEDFEPGFYVKHFIKDMQIALDEAEKMRLDVPGLKLANDLYKEIAEVGEADSGTQALYKYWKK